MKQIKYEERLKQYEAEKRIIEQTALTSKEYEEAIKKAAERWRI
ncbi:MAG: hypothetical protein PUB08_00840 [Firmicutes bacterium]|nr:hypothetical protein [Bacillota bacterium]